MEIDGEWKSDEDAKKTKGFEKEEGGGQSGDGAAFTKDEVG